MKIDVRINSFYYIGKAFTNALFLTYRNFATFR